MPFNAQTKQFKKEIQYFNNLIEDYKKNPDEIKKEKIRHNFYDNFKHIYDNEELVEEADELGLILWIVKFSDKDCDLKEIHAHQTQKQ